MTKAELVAVVAQNANLTKKDAEVCVNAVFGAITDELKKGEKVQIVGFGSFSTTERAERTCYNPRTKKPVTVAATRAPKFTAGKALKDDVAK